MPSFAQRAMSSIYKRRKNQYEEIGGLKLNLPTFDPLWIDTLDLLLSGEQHSARIEVTDQLFNSKPLSCKMFRPIFVFESNATMHS